MGKELDFFTIGNSFGGNQSWMTDPWMHLGGCGALTACDTCIYLARHRGQRQLYPFDAHNLKKSDYMKFSKIMKPFLRPRASGINTLKIYIDGFTDYLETRNETLEMTGFDGSEPVAHAIEVVKKQIDAGLPIACLTLNHRNPAYKDYVWHWFLLVGYEEAEDVFKVKIATYGEYIWEDFRGLWDTGFEEKGGLVLYK